MMKKNTLVWLTLLVAAIAWPAAAAPAPAPQPPIRVLRRNIERIARGVRADWGIYLLSLDSGEEVAIHANRPMETMSDIKVALLVTAFRQIDAGKLRLDRTVTMRARDRRFGTGVLRALHPGLKLTLRDVLTLMVIQSDNTATDLAYRLVGGPKVVTQTMRSLGFNQITTTRTAFEWFRALAAAADPSYANITPGDLFKRGYPPTSQAVLDRFDAQDKTPFGISTARQMGKLLAMIAQGKAASPASCRRMIRILRMQQMNTRIPKYIHGAAIAHKTGDFPPYIANDVAIIQSPAANFVLVVFDDRYRGIYANLEDAVARIAQQAWLYFRYRSGERSAETAYVL